MGGDILSNGTYFRLTEKNMADCKLVMNLPFIQTKKEGVYLNDFKLTYRRVTLNVFSPKKTSIKGLFISENPIQKLGTSTGNYNLFDFMGSIGVIDMSIRIKTAETTDIIELRGVNRFIS